MTRYGDVHQQLGYGSGKIGFGKSPAILVIDFQRCFSDADALLGGGDHVRQAVKNCGRLLEFARSKGIPIIYTVVAYREDKKDMGWWPVKIPKLCDCLSGSRWEEVSDEVKPEKGDVVIVKKMPSGFFGTGLLNMLISQNIDTTVITGATTSGCVRATIIDSFSYGFRTIVVDDCCGDQSEAPHRANLTDVANRYADVISLEACLQELEIVWP